MLAVEESLPDTISDSNLTNFLNQVLQAGFKSSLPSGAPDQFRTEDPILPPEMEALVHISPSERFHNEVLNQLRSLGARHLGTTHYSPTHQQFSGWHSRFTGVPSTTLFNLAAPPTRPDRDLHSYLQRTQYMPGEFQGVTDEMDRSGRYGTIVEEYSIDVATRTTDRNPKFRKI